MKLIEETNNRNNETTPMVYADDNEQIILW